MAHGGLKEYKLDRLSKSLKAGQKQKLGLRVRSCDVSVSISARGSVAVYPSPSQYMVTEVLSDFIYLAIYAEKKNVFLKKKKEKKRARKLI
jgi:hypothetical protein